MNSRSIALTACLAAVGILFSSTVAAKDKPSTEPPSIWMKKKLDFSRGILAGLTEKDFTKVTANAQAMHILGYFEKWDRANKPEYRRQLSYFELANRELIRQAQGKNLDGATLAFNQLTISCVQCHKVVRDTGNER